MRIGLYGDSTQKGLMVYNGVVMQAEFPPSAVLQMMLDRVYGAGSHVVSTYAFGGTTIWQSMSTALFEGKTLLQHISSSNDDIVVVNYGINDAFIPGYTATAHKANYAAVKDVAEDCGKTFIYESPNPLNNVHHQVVAALDAAVKGIPGIKVMDTFGGIQRLYPQWQTHLSDGTHPNPIMYFWIGDYLFKTICPHFGEGV